MCSSDLAVTVIPSHDQCVFAVRPETGLNSVEEIAERRLPLKILLRGDPRHGLHAILDHIAAAAGFSLAELRAWGGSTRLEGMLPWPDTPKFAALVSGEVDAVFDEGAGSWVNEALAAGLRILPLRDATLRQLEALGLRRGVLTRSAFPGLPADVASIDFSGWPVFTHADMDERRVWQICAALDARRHLIPW